MNDSKTARDVIVAALTARHEELSGEASPRDFDGASQILRALDAEGYSIVKLDSPDEVPTHDLDGNRIPEWERDLFAKEAAAQHLALWSGDVACGARYPGMLSVSHPASVNCRACLRASEAVAR